MVVVGKCCSKKTMELKFQESVSSWESMDRTVIKQTQNTVTNLKHSSACNSKLQVKSRGMSVVPLGSSTLCSVLKPSVPCMECIHDTL